MNTIIYTVVVTLVVCLPLSGQGLNLPEDDPFVASATGLQSNPEITQEELAMPPDGEIQKVYLRDVNAIRAQLSENMTTAPSGAEGRDAVLYQKLILWKGKLDTLAQSRLQSDVFAGMECIKDYIHAKESEELPDFFMNQLSLMRELGPTIVNAMQLSITAKSADVSQESLKIFVSFFALAGFFSEADWEDEPMPVDAAGIMILDAAAVASELKAQSWQRAELFIGGRTVEEAFARYSGDGTGLPVLKSKYAANKALVEAKWNEVQAWVETQRPDSE
jgi:hypothetical protein